MMRRNELLARLTALALLAGSALPAQPALPAGAAGPPPSTQPQPLLERRIQVSRLEGVINPITAAYVRRIVQRAERRRAELLIIALDTPGGFDRSMRDIVQTLLRSQVPTVVYVWPPGARAGSAGVFITLAADVAAMAPGTNIGAAHPVQLSPGPGGLPTGARSAPGVAAPDPVMEKATNDAAAFARSLAEQRGRNADWAERAVRESASVAAAEALQLHVVDEVAPTLEDLLLKLDGRKVKGTLEEQVLRTRDARVEIADMNAVESLLHSIVDPNVAYVLFTVGTTAIIAELYAPGAIIPAVVGSICLLLALVALGMLPINLGGLALLLVAVGMFVAELKIASHGLLTAGGLVAFVLGSLLLFAPYASPPEPLAPPAHLSPWLIALVALLLGSFFAFAVRAGLAVKRRRPLIDASGLAGAVGVTETELTPLGTVRVQSEQWTALAAGAAIPSGTPVRVLRREGLRLVVEPSSATRASSADSEQDLAGVAAVRET